jgi:hypothetical protein
MLETKHGLEKLRLTRRLSTSFLYNKKKRIRFMSSEKWGRRKCKSFVFLFISFKFFFCFVFYFRVERRKRKAPLENADDIA